MYGLKQSVMYSASSKYLVLSLIQKVKVWKHKYVTDINSRKIYIYINKSFVLVVNISPSSIFNSALEYRSLNESIYQ